MGIHKNKEQKQTFNIYDNFFSKQNLNPYENWAIESTFQAKIDPNIPNINKAYLTDYKKLYEVIEQNKIQSKDLNKKLDRILIGLQKSKIEQLSRSNERIDEQIDLLKMQFNRIIASINPDPTVNLVYPNAFCRFMDDRNNSISFCNFKNIKSLETIQDYNDTQQIWYNKYNKSLCMRQIDSEFIKQYYGSHLNELKDIYDQIQTLQYSQQLNNNLIFEYSHYSHDGLARELLSQADLQTRTTYLEISNQITKNETYCQLCEEEWTRCTNLNYPNIRIDNVIFEAQEVFEPNISLAKYRIDMHGELYNEQCKVLSYEHNDEYLAIAKVYIKELRTQWLSQNLQQEFGQDVQNLYTDREKRFTTPTIDKVISDLSTEINNAMNVDIKALENVNLSDEIR